MQQNKMMAITLIIGILFLGTACSKKKVEVLELKIDSLKGVEVNCSRLNISGTIKTTGKFSERYSLWLYKSIDGGLYWQDCTLSISGDQWNGSVNPQKDGFSPEELQAGVKIEGVIAVVYEKDRVTELPGYKKDRDKVSMADLDKILPTDLGINKSLIEEFQNKCPSQKR